MVGPKPGVSPEEILVKLLSYDIYNDSGNLKSRKDNVWQLICDDLNNNIKPVNLYFQVSQDRHNILSSYRKSKDLEIFSDDDDAIEVNNAEHSNSDEDESDLIQENIPKKRRKIINPSKKNRLDFDFILSYEQYEQISPVKAIYKDEREGLVLQTGWQGLMRRNIYKTEKLPCAFSFKRCKIDEVDAYIRINGYCRDRDCNSEITIVCLYKPTLGESITFNVNATNTKGVPHTAKNRLQGSERIEVLEELRHKKPKQWRRDKAVELMEHGDCEPPILYNLPSLQKASQELKNKDLGIKKGSSLFESLSELKKCVEFNKFIRNIGYDKFYITYWSPDQVSLHNDIQRKLNNELALDSTSSVGLKIDRPDGKSSDLYLTILSSYVNNSIIPLCQTISETNDTNFFNYWLNDFKKSGATDPNLLVTDMGKALQNGACLSFNKMTLREYNDHCLRILQTNDTDRKLYTQLRIDIAHFQHVISMWPCISKGPKKVKELYLRCTGFMSSISNLNHFVEFLEFLLYVAMIKIYSSKCADALQYLAKKIKTYKFDEELCKISETNDVEGKIEDEILDAHTDKKSRVQIFIDNIHSKVENTIKNDLNTDHSSSFDQTNDYYLPDFVKRFVDLCKEFPCWSNVMTSHFKNEKDVATSARGEALFNEFKNSILENRKPLRCDKVIIKHCRQINGDIILARAAINDIQPKKKVTEKKVSKDENEHLHQAERWKNKISLQLIDEESNATENLDNRHNLITTDSNNDDGMNEPAFDMEPSFDKNTQDDNNKVESKEKCIKTDTDMNECQHVYENSFSINHDHDYGHVTLNEENQKPLEEADVIIDEEGKSSTIFNEMFICDTYFDFIDNVDKVSTIIDVKYIDDNETIAEVNDGYTEKKDCIELVDVNIINNNNDDTEKKRVDLVEVKNELSKTDKPLKTRGIYVSPDPDFDLEIQEANGQKKISTKKKANIQNGNRLQPKSLYGFKVTLINTCPFDSISEILSHCCSINSFKNFLEENSDYADNINYKCYASALLKHYESGITAKLYTSRLYILDTILKKINHTIDCNKNVGEMFQLLMKNYNSLKEITSCVCGNKKENKKIVLPIPNTSIVWLNNYNNLQEEVNKYFEKKQVYCDMCHTSSAELDFVLGPYMYIDTEDAYKYSTYAKQLNIDSKTIKTCLNMIPTKLVIKENTFVLGGVIKYDEPMIDGGIGHYVAYCRTLKDIWIERNDLVKSSKVLSSKQLPSIKIAAIFYVNIKQ